MKATRAKTGGVEELIYMATRHDAKERMVDWIVAVTIAGGIPIVRSQRIASRGLVDWIWPDRLDAFALR